MRTLQFRSPGIAPGNADESAPDCACRPVRVLSHRSSCPWVHHATPDCACRPVRVLPHRSSCPWVHHATPDCACRPVRVLPRRSSSPWVHHAIPDCACRPVHVLPHDEARKDRSIDITPSTLSDYINTYPQQELTAASQNTRQRVDALATPAREPMTTRSGRLVGPVKRLGF